MIGGIRKTPGTERNACVLPPYPSDHDAINYDLIAREALITLNTPNAMSRKGFARAHALKA